MLNNIYVVTLYGAQHISKELRVVKIAGMIMTNENKRLINKLATATYRNNRVRNRILILAIVAGIIAIFSILALITGKIDAIYLMGIRSTGDASSVFLEKPSEQLYSQVKQLDYISDVGGEWDLGSIMEGKMTVGFCVYSDETKFNNIDVPAYTDIIGNYPQKRNEVMLSKHSLELLRIHDPEIGQFVNLNITMDEETYKKEEFVLSGYYTDYIEGSYSRAYFSKSYASEVVQNIKLPEYLYLRHKDTIGLEKAEAMLYKDVRTKSDTQQFIISDTAEHRAVAQAVGGYGQGIICGVLILLCIFLLIYNVMNLSLRNDIRFYGQLKTIGIDAQDTIKIILLQIRHILIWGIMIGTICGVILSLFLIPKLLSDVYLDNYGPATNMMGFKIEFLFISIIFVTLVTLISTMLPVWKIARMSPIAAMRYNGKTSNKKSYIAKKRKTPYRDMALKNLSLDKGKSIVVISSVAIGIIFAQCSMIIIGGLDQTNKYEFLPDFYISNGNAPLTNEGYTSNTNTIDNTMLETILDIDGIEDVTIDYATYVKFDVHDRAWYPILKVANANLGYGDNSQIKRYIQDKEGEFDGSIAILTEEEMNKLAAYAEKNDFDWDITGLKNGDIALNATSHIFTNKMEAEASEISGDSITIYNYEGEKQGSIRFGGYIDIEKEGFPVDNKKAWGRKEWPSLFVSEKGYKKLDLEKKVHRIELNVDQDQLNTITKKINHIVERRNLVLMKDNPELVMDENILLTDKASLIKEEEKFVFMSKVVMYTIAAILICMGIINFINAVMTNIISLKREYTMMEVIGMERKQLQRIITYEGLLFALSVLMIVFSLGSIALYTVHYYVAGKYPYYSFAYPIVPTFIIVISIICFSIIIPYIILNINLKDSVVERLRKVI